MSARAPEFHLKFAESPQEIEAAQRLRYEVFVKELGAGGPDVDHSVRLEADRFDAYARHLLLIDRDQSFNHGVVGTYRLLPGAAAEQAGGFYSASEFDLAPLLASGRRLLELGRSCVLAEYRRGTATFELWAGLAEYVLSGGAEVLFGVASFHGTDLQALAQPLAHLHHSHLAAPAMRVSALGPPARDMALLPPEAVDRKAAMLALPPLIKAYLRIGGQVGQGAWLDEAFNTTDVCMLLDVDQIPGRQRALYAKGRLEGRGGA